MTKGLRQQHMIFDDEDRDALVVDVRHQGARGRSLTQVS
jgi:hypothetical protein